MLDTKYAVKYKMPHSLLHIVDNSANDIPLPQSVANDPSLFSTIVVTATPIGLDDRIVNLTRADVAAVSYGLNSVTAEDIEKYGQSITYPMSLIENGSAPVRLLRVTPDGSTYAHAIILVQWCLENREYNEDEKDMHVRFVVADVPSTIRVERFKNTEKLNAAIVAHYETEENSEFVDENGKTWKQRVFINALSAGRGKAYNDMAFAINLPVQGKRQANVRYEFATINTKNGLVIEDFFASLSNASTTKFYASTLDDVNVVVNKRVEGSSVIIPYLNSKAVREVWKEYSDNIETLISYNMLDDKEIERFKLTDINTFEMVYGNYIYDGGESGLKLPRYIVDMVDVDIPQLDPVDRFTVLTKVSEDDIIDLDEFDVYNPEILFDYLYPRAYGVQENGDTLYVGDTFLFSNTGSYLNPGIDLVAAINQYTGSVTSVSYYYMNLIDCTHVINGTEDQHGPDYGTTKSFALSAYIPELAITDAVINGTPTYVLQTEEPADWETGYANYFTKDGDNYVAVAAIAAHAPAFKADTYYAHEDDEYVLLDTAPTGWDTDYANYFTKNGDNYVAVTGVTDPTWTADTYYTYTEDTTPALVQILNDNRILAKLIKNGALFSDPANKNNTIAIAFTVKDQPGVFDVLTLFISNNKVIDAKLNPKYGDVISAIDFSRNKGGTGNIIAVQNGSTPSTDPATTRPGAMFIYIPEEGVSEVFVNGYTIQKAVEKDDATDPIRFGRIPVYNNTNKFGKCPSTINMVDDMMGHQYDAIVYDIADESAAEYNKKAVRTAVPIIKNFTPVETINGSKITGTAAVGDKLYYRQGTDTEYKSSTMLEFIVRKTADGDIVSLEYNQGSLTFDGNFDTISGNLETLVGGVATTVGTITINISDFRITKMDGLVETPTGTVAINPSGIYRYTITGSLGSLQRIQLSNGVIPDNYYSNNFGENPSSEAGGLALTGGSTGFFDEALNPIEFKWRYSELLVRAYRGQIDPRIMSPTRCPAKFMFDGGTNTIVGQMVLPNIQYRPVDIVGASTIFTDEEKDAVILNEDIMDFVETYNVSNDIDVKQAMYDLMVYRCYYGMPEDKRPIGPGYGLSLHLDSGVSDAATALLINDSFKRRFTNPNASWDIGGYVSAENGVAYTYTKWIVDNLIKHCKAISINKPFVMSYATIPNTEYSSFFPDIDTTDWELRELLYNSGGNAWIPDINGNLVRRSQRTLQTTSDTSDLVQESNMRTLSQLCYLLQNKIDSFLLEYDDEGSVKTLSDQVNNMFVNWPGYLVDTLNITFERDTNPLDGGDIVVCYVNVTFRGLILRVPIVVNVNRRISR